MFEVGKKSIDDYIENRLILKRFKDINDLRDILNEFFTNAKYDFGDKSYMFVQDICEKSYYDNDFQDYEILVQVGNEEEDLLDITIYYAITRIGEKIIVETSYEEI